MMLVGRYNIQFPFFGPNPIKKLLFLGSLLLFGIHGYGQNGVVTATGESQEGVELEAVVSDAEGLSPGQVTYLWERSADGSDPWTSVGGTTDTYNLTVDDVGQFIRVTASYTDGSDNEESPSYSVPGPILAAGDTEAPTAPSNLVVVGEVGSNSVTLSWTAATDNEGVTEYLVYNAADELVANTPGTLTSVMVTGLLENTAYSFRAIAQDAAGNGSPASNTVAITTTVAPDIVPPTVPQNFRIVGDVTPESVTLAWEASTDDKGVVEEYRISRDGAFHGSVSGVVTEYNDNSLTPATTYRYTVLAQDDSRNPSSSSPVLIVNTPGLPGIGVGNATVNEDAGSATFTVRAQGALFFTTTIAYMTVNGSALAGVHYQAVTGNLTFSANQREHTIEVPVIRDGVADGNKVFYVDIRLVSGFANISQSRGTGTIVDIDDCVAQPVQDPDIPVTFCANFTQELNEYVSETIPAGFSLVWSRSDNYSNTGSRLTNSVVTGARTYYGFYYNSVTGCTSKPLAITLTRSNPPATPSVTAAAICGPGTATLGASSATAGATLYWYASETGGERLAEGSVFNTPQISATTTYYVEAYANGCSSPRVPVVASVGTPIDLGTVQEQVETCNVAEGGTTTLNLESLRSGGNATGIWSVVGTPPGAVAITAGSMVDFLGLPEGDYVFRFTSNNAQAPCQNASATVTVTVGDCRENETDLSLAKTVDRDRVSENSEVSFTITLSNRGATIFRNIRVNELLDPSLGFEYVSHIESKGIYNPVRGVWDIPELMDYEVVTLTLVAKTIKQGTFQNIAAIRTSEPQDMDSGNNMARVSVRVEPPSFDECGYLFNQISPNGDGVNDALHINCIEQYPNNAIQIYDRYGNEVFVARKYDNSWMGTGKNGNLPKGTYFYTLDLGDGTPVKKGWIQIIR